MTDLRAVRPRKWRAPAFLLLGALAVCASWFGTRPVEAQAPLIIRMATLVPDGSSWFQILKETGERWKQASGGRVTVRLFPGGVAGDDPDVVRKMRLGTLNAASETEFRACRRRRPRVRGEMPFRARCASAWPPP